MPTAPITDWGQTAGRIVEAWYRRSQAARPKYERAAAKARSEMAPSEAPAPERERRVA